MIRSPFKDTWRAQSRAKRIFYATYMKWLLRFGYSLVLILLIGAVAAFNYKVDDVIKADGVQLSARSHEIRFSGPCRIVRVIATNGSDVSEGDLLFEVVRGDADIQAQTALDGLTAAQTASISALAKDSITKALVTIESPKKVIVKAPSNGVFWMKLDPPSKTIAADEVIARIADYSTVECESNLKGESVFQAANGMQAILTGIQISSPNQTTLKLSTSEKNSIVSRNILGSGIRDVLNQELNGKELLVPKDLPLKISEVTDVEVNSVAYIRPGRGQYGTLMDLAGDYKLSGTVESGEHILTAQLADLPKDILDNAMKAVEERVQGQSIVSQSQGESKSFEIGSLTDFSFVLKVKATEENSISNKSNAVSDVLRGSSLERSFKATIVIKNVPKEFAARMRAADLNGNKVTAKVEVKTGSKPIALMLLKRS